MERGEPLCSSMGYVVRLKRGPFRRASELVSLARCGPAKTREVARRAHVVPNPPINAGVDHRKPACNVAIHPPRQCGVDEVISK